MTSLAAKQDHLTVLRYIRAHELREPELVVSHGKSLLGGNLRKHPSSLDAASRTSALEQICLAALDLHDLGLAQTCLQEIVGQGVSKESERFQRLAARCLEAAGDATGAMILYDEMLTKNPSNAIALQRKYCVLRAQGEPAETVLEALNDYLGQQMSDVSGWYEMAQLRVSMGDFKGAAYALEQVILGCPLDSLIHRQLAEVYATMGGVDNTILARRHMAQALELDPTDVRAQLELVHIANQYLEESIGAGKKVVNEHEQQVAKELVRFGAVEVLNSYKGTKLVAIVKRVLDDYTTDLD